MRFSYKNFFRKILKHPFIFISVLKLQKAVKKGSGLKIVIGSSGIFQKGWISTDIEFLNMLNNNDWKKFFKINSIDAILAEHVWEHLNQEEGLLAAENCYKYLKKGGYLRIAVPDGNNPDKLYVRDVKPGGTGAGSDTHKVLYTHETLGKILGKAGFKIEILEFFDCSGNFHYKEWDIKDGMINRSKRFDKRNKHGKLFYTSLIVDAYKI